MAREIDPLGLLRDRYFASVLIFRELCHVNLWRLRLRLRLRVRLRVRLRLRLRWGPRLLRIGKDGRLLDLVD